MENYKALPLYEIEIESIYLYLKCNYETAVQVSAINMFKVIGAPILSSVLHAIKHSKFILNSHLRELAEYEQFMKTLPVDLQLGHEYRNMQKKSINLCKKLNSLTLKALNEISLTESTLAYDLNSTSLH